MNRPRSVCDKKDWTRNLLQQPQLLPQTMQYKCAEDDAERLINCVDGADPPSGSAVSYAEAGIESLEDDTEWVPTEQELEVSGCIPSP